MGIEITWEQCINIARTYSSVVISGCQRTGTTYMAHELSNVLGYKHYDENHYGVHSLPRFKEILYRDENKVIQAPALLQHMEEISYDAMVIIISRNEDDVAMSMIKHGWFKREGKKEYNKFKEGTPTTPQEVYRAKMEYGRSIGLYVIDYDELRKSNGFIENREGFDIKQIKRG